MRSTDQILFKGLLIFFAVSIAGIGYYLVNQPSVDFEEGEEVEELVDTETTDEPRPTEPGLPERTDDPVIVDTEVSTPIPSFDKGDANLVLVVKSANGTPLPAIVKVRSFGVSGKTVSYRCDIHGRVGLKLDESVFSISHETMIPPAYLLSVSRPGSGTQYLWIDHSWMKRNKAHQVILPQSRRFSGKAHDENGAPLANVPLSLSRVFRGKHKGWHIPHIHNFKTDAKGHFHVNDIAPGEYHIEGYGSHAPKHVQKIMVAGDTRANLLLSPQYPLNIDVVDHKLDPVPNVLVSWIKYKSESILNLGRYRRVHPVLTPTRADSQGRLKLMVHVRDILDLQLSKTGHIGLSKQGLAITGRKRLELKMQKLIARRFSGFVQVGNSETPITGARVSLHETLHKAEVAATRSQKDGSFVFKVIPGTAFLIRINSDGYSSLEEHVYPGRLPSNRVYRLEKIGYKTYTLKDRDSGDILANTRVNVSGKNRTGTYVTDAQGKVRIPFDTKGDQTLTLEIDGRVDKKISIDASGNLDEEEDLLSAKAKVLKCRVINKDKHPLREVQISIQRGNFSPFVTPKFNLFDYDETEGCYLIPVEMKTSYNIRFHQNGYQKKDQRVFIKENEQWLDVTLYNHHRMAITLTSEEAPVPENITLLFDTKTSVYYPHSYLNPNAKKNTVKLHSLGEGKFEHYLERTDVIAFRVSAENFETSQSIKLKDLSEEESEYEIAMSKGLELNGYVQDKDGNFIPHAKLSVVIDKKSVIRTEIGSDGHFTMGGLRPARLHILVSHPDYMIHEFYHQFDAESNEPLKIVLKRGGVVSGKTLDRDGIPVSGVAINHRTHSGAHYRQEFYLHGHQPNKVAEKVHSDESGFYTLKKLKPGDHDIYVDDDQYISNILTVSVKDGEILKDQNLTLRTGLAIGGTVKDISGGPIAGLKLQIYDYKSNRIHVRRESISDTNGSFLFDGLSHAHKGHKYRIMLHDKNYSLLEPNKTYEPGNKNIQLRVYGKTVYGKVSAEDGSVPESYEVGVITGKARPRKMQSNANRFDDGRFSVSVSIYGKDRFFKLQATNADQAGESEWVDIGTYNGTDIPVTLKSSRIFKVKVFMSEGEIPVNDANVNMNIKTKDKGYWYIKGKLGDDDGVYFFTGLRPGSATLHVTKTGFPNQNLTFNIPAKGEIPEREVMISPPARVFGTLKRSDGKPAANLQLSFKNKQNHYRQGNTNSEGYFELDGFNSTTYELRVNNPHFRENTRKSPPFQTIKFEAGEEKEVDWTLADHGTIDLIVEGDLDQYSYMQFRLMQKSGSKLQYYLDMKRASFLKDLYPVHPGEYTAHLQAGGPGGVRLNKKQEVKITSGKNTIDWSLPNTGIAGKVKDENGTTVTRGTAKLFEMHVDVEQTDAKPVKTANINQGNFSIVHDPGQYQLLITPQNVKLQTLHVDYVEIIDGEFRKNDYSVKLRDDWKKIANPEISAYPVTSPVIDGNLDDDAWGRPEQVNRLFTLEDHREVTIPSAFWLGYDQDALYVAAKLTEPDVSKLKLEAEGHDGRTWNDDSIEVYLDTNHDKKTYYLFIINADGVVYDAKGKDTKWRGDIETRTKIADKAWNIELKVPWAVIGMSGPPLGSKIGLELIRNRPRPRGIFQWAPTDGRSNHRPEHFGTLKF